MAKTTVGKLNAILTLSSDAFNRGLKGAKSHLSRFGSGIASGIATIAKYGAAMAAVAVGGLAVFVKRELEAMDAIAKTAQSLGIATEALTGLQYAAQISGVSTDDLTAKLRYMEKAIGNARSGSSEVAKALADIGISVRQIESLSPEKQFALIADRLNLVANQSDKARIAQALFGRSALSIVPLLAEGSAGMAALRAEAKKLGYTFGDEAAAKVDMASDAMDRLKALMTGALRTAVIELAPFIQSVADRLTEMGLAGDGVGAKVTAAFSGVLRIVAKLADWFNLLKAAFYGLQTIVLGGLTFIFKAVDDLVMALTKVLDLVGVDLPAGIRDFTKAMTEGLEQDTIDALDKAGKAMDKFIEGDASKRAEVFIKGIQEGADKAAAELAAKARMRLQPAAELDSSAESKGSFAQIVRSRTAFGAPQQPGNRGLSVRGMNEAMMMLNDIRMLLRHGAIARAV